MSLPVRMRTNMVHPLETTGSRGASFVCGFVNNQFHSLRFYYTIVIVVLKICLVDVNMFLRFV